MGIFPRKDEIKLLTLCLVGALGLFALLTVARVKRSAFDAVAEGGGKVVAAAMTRLEPPASLGSISPEVSAPPLPDYADESAAPAEKPSWPKGTSLFRPLPPSR